MSEPLPKRPDSPRPITLIRSITPTADLANGTGPQTAPAADKMLCERCGVEMYRMHAVWRCPGCGFKTDCCGW